MNKEELLRNIKDEVARERCYESWAKMMAHFLKNKLMVVSWVMIEKAYDRYAIACCEGQKKEIASKYSKSGYIHNEILTQEILKTKNVAE